MTLFLFTIAYIFVAALLVPAARIAADDLFPKLTNKMLIISVVLLYIHLAILLFLGI